MDTANDVALIRTEHWYYFDFDGSKWCQACVKCDGAAIEWPCPPHRIAERVERLERIVAGIGALTRTSGGTGGRPPSRVSVIDLKAVLAKQT